MHTPHCGFLHRVRIGAMVATLLAAPTSWPAAETDPSFNYPAPPNEGETNYFPVAENGQARCVVVCRPDLQGPAEGLRVYLQRATGAPIGLIPDGNPVPDGMAAIHVGDTTVSTNTPLNLPDLCYGPDRFPNLNGYLVKTVDPRTLVIRGLTAKATQHGIVGFLRRYVGVRQYWEGAPGSLGEVVPAHPVLYVPQVEWRDWPYFFSRHLSQRPFSAGRGPLDFFRRNNTLPCSENYYRLLPPAQYAGTHPEYFCVVNDGKRLVPAADQDSGWQPCLSNPDVARIMAAAVVDHFRKDPGAVGFNVSINDGGRDCLCEACRAMDTPAAPYAERMGDRYVKFTDSVCDLVAREFPSKHIVFLAYGMARRPPRTAELHRMILPVMTVNSLFEGWDEWMAAGPAHMGVYLHHDDTLFFVIPKLDVYQAARRIQYIVSTGRARVFYMEAYPHWPISGLVPYVTAELLWDPRLDVKDLLEEFYAKFFGPAAGPMQTFYETLIAGYEHWLAENGIPHATGQDLSSTSDSRSFRQFNVVSLAGARQASAALKQAAVLSAGDATAARRVEAVQRMFDLVEPCVESYWLSDELNTIQVRSDAEAQSVVANSRRMVVLSRTMAAHIATVLGHTPPDLYGAVFSQPDNKRPIELYEALRAGRPLPEVTVAIGKGADAAGEWLRKELGPDGAARWWDRVIAEETEPDLKQVFELARLSSGAGELKTIYRSDFDAVGRKLAPADLDLMGGDQEVVIDGFTEGGGTNHYAGRRVLQDARFGVYLWHPDRTPFTLALTRRDTPDGTFALMAQHVDRGRLGGYAQLPKDSRQYRVGFGFKRNAGMGRYTAEVRYRLPGGTNAPVALLNIPEAPDVWHQIAANVEVPEGASGLFVNLFVGAQAADAKCWIHNLFMSAYVQPATP